MGPELRNVAGSWELWVRELKSHQNLSGVAATFLCTAASSLCLCLIPTLMDLLIPSAYTEAAMENTKLLISQD